MYWHVRKLNVQTGQYDGPEIVLCGASKSSTYAKKKATWKYGKFVCVHIRKEVRGNTLEKWARDTQGNWNDITQEWEGFLA